MDTQAAFEEIRKSISAGDPLISGKVLDLAKAD